MYFQRALKPSSAEANCKINLMTHYRQIERKPHPQAFGIRLYNAQNDPARLGARVPTSRTWGARAAGR
jgi:hypothetical protein